uniref:U2-Lycotoxin-Lsp1a_3 n=1 Tax=Lycosa sp. SGP-2016 TaxID=1905177 RepID=A0A482ZJW6_9ARAC
MRTSTILGLCAVVVLLLTIADFSGADEINAQDAPEERGYCAEKGIRCDDIHCCTGLKCKCNDSGYNCVCRKK